eukprot:13781573-Alexandrium_andersonii.AAC.1
MPEVYTLKWTWCALCPYLRKQCCDSYKASLRTHDLHASECDCRRAMSTVGSLRHTARVCRGLRLG